MSNYVKATNFTSKDALAIGNPLKIIKGTEFDVEFNAIAAAVATKSDASDLAVKADTTTVNAALALKAPLASPALTGTPTAPTASVNTNNTQVATTAFVVAQIADDAPTKTGTGASGTWGINITGNAATATTATTATTASTVTTVTTVQVLNATANATAGAVGTYSWLEQASATPTIINVGSTYSGSSFVYTGSYAGSVSPSSIAPSGTWRAMSQTQTIAGATTRSALFLRIS